jgi:uncharacterized membrane protein YbhN (UPF0104 family)
VTGRATLRRPPAWLSFGLTVAAVGVLGWFVARDLDALDTLRSISVRAVIVIFVLQALYLVPESFRQQVVVESAGRTRLSPFRWFRVFVIGRFLNSLIPQSGNVYRALRLQSESGIGYVDYVGSMALFLPLSVGLNLILAALLTAVSPDGRTGADGMSPLILLAAGALALAIPAVGWWLLERANLSHSAWTSPLRVLKRILGSAADAARQPGLAVRFLTAWAVTLVIVLALYGVVLSSVGASLGLGETLVLYALVQATSFLVITPGNIGIQELGFTGLAAVFGVPLAQGVAASAIIRVTGWLVLAVLAFAFGTRDVLAYLPGSSGDGARTPESQPSDDDG